MSHIYLISRLGGAINGCLLNLNPTLARRRTEDSCALIKKVRRSEPEARFRPDADG